MQQVELAPVAARERIEVMDVLRGFALLGILWANVRQMFLPLDAGGFARTAPAATRPAG